MAENRGLCNEDPDGEAHDEQEGGVVNNSLDQSVSQHILLECGCSQRCLNKLSKDDVADHRLSLCDMEKSEKDMLLMRILTSLQRDSDNLFCGKRKRAHFNYSFKGVPICTSAFHYVYNVGIKQLKNLLKDMAENGPVHATHSRQIPPTAAQYPGFRRCRKVWQIHKLVC